MILEAVMGIMAVEDEAAKLRKGDPDALVAMVERYGHRLHRYLLRLVHDRAAAEDLFQQTWLRVVANIRRYDARKDFDAWLFSVAHNLAIDHLRRREPRSLDEPLGSGISLGEEVADSGPDPFANVLAFERARLLETALGALPAVYREVLTLRFEEDMKLEEIAVVCGTPLSTVKSRLRRGLEGLRRKLQGEGRL